MRQLLTCRFPVVSAAKRLIASSSVRHPLVPACAVWLVLLASASLAFAQPGWQRLNGEVDSVFYKREIRQSIVRTYDTLVPVAIPNEVPLRAITGSLFVASSGCVFVGSSTGIYALDPLEDAPTHYVTDSTFGFAEQSGTVWAATSGGLRYTTNNGKTWNIEQQQLGDNHTRSIISLSSGTLYTTASRGLFARPLGANAWTQVTGVASLIVRVAEANDSLVLIDMDHVWLAGAGGVAVRDLSHHLPPFLQVVGLDNQIYGLTDALLEVWKPISEWVEIGYDLRRQGRDVYTIASSRVGEHRLWAGTEKGLSYTSDTGKTWQSLTGTQKLGAITSVGFSETSTIFAVAEDKLVRSINGGQTWEGAQGVLRYDTVLRHDTVYRIDTNIVADTVHTNTILSSRSVTGIFVRSPQEIDLSTNAGVIRTTNGGVSWQQKNHGIPSTHLIAIAGMPQGLGTSSSLFVADSIDVYLTINGGDDWAALPRGWSSASLRGILYSPRGYLVVWSNSGVFRTLDYGEHWNGISAGIADLDVRRVVVTADGTLIAWTADEYYRSTNDGSLWNPIPQVHPATYSLGLATDGRSRVVVFNEWMNFISDDAGQTWDTVRSLGEDLWRTAVGPRGEVLFYSDDQGNWRIVWSTDRMRTLKVAYYTLPGVPSDLAFDSLGNAYAGTTTDGLYMHPPFTLTGSVRTKTSVAGSALYPNPASIDLHLLAPDHARLGAAATSYAARLRILDVTGRRVLERTLTESAFTLSVQDIPDGIYAIQWLDGASQILGTDRFVVRH